jgi:hypothetical protein
MQGIIDPVASMRNTMSATPRVDVRISTIRLLLYGGQNHSRTSESSEYQFGAIPQTV